MNHNEWHESNLQGKATLDWTGCALEKFKCQDQQAGNLDEDKPTHKKLHQLEGNKLKKWLKKCYERRQERKSGLDKRIDSQPWVCVERNKIKCNSMIRFATWNVRTLRTLDSIMLVVEDLKKHRIMIAGIQECRWLKESNGRKQGEYKFWGGGAWKNDAQAAQGGVAIAVHKSLWKSVERFILVSGRTAVMTLRSQMGKRIVFCTAWCPVEEDSEVAKEQFWTDFQKMAKHPELKTCAADTRIVTGDFNGELPPYDKELDETSQSVVGRWNTSTHESNMNGMRLYEEASQLKLCAASSQVRSSRKKAWTFLFRTAINGSRRVYDHSLVPYKDKGNIKKSMVVRDTLHESDHGLVVTDMKLPHTSHKKQVTGSQTTKKLRTVHIANVIEEKLHLSNRYATLEHVQNDEVQQAWTDFQQTIVEAAESSKSAELMVPKKPWISEDTMELIRRRATTKKLMLENEDKAKHSSYADELYELRKNIKSSARRDKKNWLKDIIEDIQKAGNVGNSEKVYANVKKLTGKQGSPPASLDGIDSDIWVKFFSNLLGKEAKPDEVAGSELKEKLAWRISLENLEPGKRTRQWDMDLSTPNEEEVVNVLKKAAKGKSVSESIPTELWQNCPTARKILTIFIQKVWEGATPPDEWLNAVLCLLYKQKGNVADPNSYRGISLLSSAEKIISLIILTRIKPHMEHIMNKRQSGFTTGKSCRNAVFVLLRDLEKSILENKPLIFNFVDFKKAFDSLDWDTMWKIMEAQGMPVQMVNIIKELYNNATVAVRLNMEGGMAPSFKQKVGIRQGCSLSPAIFVLILDYAMKAYMQACEALGIDEDADWLGYADDLAIKSTEVDKAEAVFHQLQAACAFVGLHCNIGKTECMARGIVQQTTPEPIACKERIQVAYSDGKFEGWLVDWIGRAKLVPDAEFDLSNFPSGPTHLIIFDPDDHGDSDIIAIQMGKNGWLTDQDGDKHRCKLLGSKEFIDDKKNKSRCDNCKNVFFSERALKAHQATNCRIRQDMSADEQAKLRRKRETNASIAGRRTSRVENIPLKDVFDNLLKAVAEFKYLGTLTTTDGLSTKEINRRLGIAGSTMASLNKLWADTSISLTLKCQLYKALVMTIVLYNGECWRITKQDLKKLEGFHFRCLRRLTRRFRKPNMGDMDIDRASKEDVFKASQVPTMEELLREKRMRWFGHLIRENDDNLAKQVLMREKQLNSKWFQLLKSDLASRRISVHDAELLALDKLKWRRISSSFSTRYASPGVRLLPPPR